ncbi:MAG: inner rane transport permease [Gammaproteobacteria bacterium]|jgi:ABC-2 type transport system permease protein|nr:inner rane transport permease [Gammaproteobacteria bacterium]
MNFREKWIAFYGLLFKEVSRFMRIWPQSLLPSAITMVLYFMIFGNVIGSRIGEMGGLNYISFITPGLIMMAIVTNSYSNVVSSFYGSRFSRSIEEMLVSPMPNWLIVLGYGAGGLARGIVVGAIVLVISWFFAGVHVEHAFLVLFTVILCSFLFSLAGLINGIFARKFDDTAIVTTFVLTPLIYLGGVFYSIDSLPPFWRAVSLFNPLRYVIDLFRYAMLGVGGDALGLALSIVTLFTLGLFTACVYLMNKGIGIKS